ncbi:MAG: hypothetical protein NC388_01380 [Clostridium sp.]|nr:hypothetical protein [Clostridium sp.]
MKIIRFCQLGCMLAAAALCFTACGDDEPEVQNPTTKLPGGDEGDEGDSGSSVDVGYAQQSPLLSQMGIRFPVTSISHSGYTTCTFTYEGGRMTGGNLYDETFAFIPAPLQLVYEESWDGGYYRDTYRNIRLNEQGCMVSVDITSEGSDDEDGIEDSFQSNGRILASYDDEGHLLRWSARFDSYTPGEGEEVACVWSDGNMVSQTLTTSWVEEDEYADNQGALVTEVNEYRFEYAADQPNSGIYMDGENLAGNMDFPYLSFSGLMGKPSVQIPTIIRLARSGNGSNYERVQQVTPVYNTDGSIASVELGYLVDGEVMGGITYEFTYSPTRSASTRSSVVPTKEHGRSLYTRLKSRRSK